MAESDEIKSSDIAADNFAQPTVEGLLAIADAAGISEAAIKSLSKTIASDIGKKQVRNVADIQAVAQAERQLDTIEQVALRTRKMKAEALIQEKKLNDSLSKDAAKREKEIKNEASAYFQLSKQFKDAARAAQDFGAAMKLNNDTSVKSQKEYERLKQVSVDYNNSLKKLDADQGIYTRNVGNYHGSINSLGKGLAGLTGIVATAGNAFGIDTQELQNLAQISRELIKVTREIHHIKQLEKIAHVENAVAIEGEAVATEVADVATKSWIATMLLSPWTWIIAGLAAVAGAWYYLTKTEEESTEATIDNWERKKKLLDEEDEYMRKLRAARKKQTTFDLLGEARESKNAANKILEDIDAKYEREIFYQGKVTKYQKQKSDEDQLIYNQAQKDSKKYWEEESLLFNQYTREVDEERENKKPKEKKSIKEIREIKKQESKIEFGYSEVWWDEEAGITLEQHNYGVELVERQMKVEEERRKKQLEDRLKLEQQITSGIQQGLQERANLQQQADQKDIDQKNRMIAVQAELAAQGKKNVLTESIAGAEKAEEKKLQDAKKLQKQQQALQLADVFAKILINDLQGGKSFSQSFAEAGAGEAITKAMMFLISGSAYEGVADTGSERGNVDSKGGKLWVLHPNEEVVSAEKKAKYSDVLDTMRNDTFENVYLPSFRGSNATAKTIIAETNSFQLDVIIKQNERIANAIESKPVGSTNLEGLGEWTDRMQKNNLEIVTHHIKTNRRPSIQRHGG